MKEKNIPSCLKVLNLLASTKCLLTYIYPPLLQAVKKSMETSTINKCRDVQNRPFVYISVLSFILSKD